MSVDSFNNIIEIGNMNAIKELVTQNIGITFMYKAAAEKELEMGKLCRVLMSRILMLFVNLILSI